MAISEEDNQMVRCMIRKNILSLIDEKKEQYENQKFFLTQFNERLLLCLINLFINLGFFVGKMMRK